MKPEVYQVSKIRRSGVVLILELGFQIVGTCSLVFPDTKLNESWKSNAAYLKFLSIHPSYQGLGFAKVLLHEIHNVAQDYSFSSICVRILNTHKGLNRLFETMGYQKDTCGNSSYIEKEYIGFSLTL